MTIAAPPPTESAPAFAVQRAAIHGPSGPIVRELDFTVPAGTVTAVVGPGGAGKSSLLCALSARRLADDLRLAGTWRCFGRPRPRWDAGVSYLLPQRRPGGAPPRDPFESAAPVLLLDEPCRGLPAPELDALAAQIAAARGARTIVVVTHHVAFARAVADQILLLCGGVQDCVAPAAAFFTAPPTPMAERYIAQGNCWPAAPLPRHLRWVSPLLAGMARPGLSGPLDDELAALAAAGITVVMSLTEEPPPVAALARHGLASMHLPIPDQGAPALADARALCAEVARHLAAGARVVMHCHGGVGRTGTLLAAQLVYGGRSAAEAIRAVRAAIRYAIQTPAQEALVEALEAELARAPR
jgi:protein-tyrosine phosphatase